MLPSLLPNSILLKSKNIRVQNKKSSKLKSSFLWAETCCKILYKYCFHQGRGGSTLWFKSFIIGISCGPTLVDCLVWHPLHNLYSNGPLFACSLSLIRIWFLTSSFWISLTTSSLMASEMTTGSKRGKMPPPFTCNQK